MRHFVWVVLVCVFATVGKSQGGNVIYLNNSTIEPTRAEDKSLQANWPTNNCDTDNGCYAVIQVSDALTATDRAELSALGIHLHRYIPNLAYLASYTGTSPVELPDVIVDVFPIQPHNKRPHTPLGTGISAEGGTHYNLVGIPFPGGSLACLSADLVARGAVVTGIRDGLLYFRIGVDELPIVLDCPSLQYTESAPSLPIPEGNIGRASSRVTRLNILPGQGWDGTGIGISIADDGRVRHKDLQGRLTDNSTFDSGVHAEMTTGIAAGAGNIDPTAMGMAPGAAIHLFDINGYEHLGNAPLYLATRGIPITSTSYGEACGDTYQLATAAIDDQVFQNSALFHVFSAGNHGNDPCTNPYSWLGPNTYGQYHNTITGGRKAGKNVLAVGNVASDDQLLVSSSIGPTPDGRIKPDLAALGQLDYTMGANNAYQNSSGTSAAAPNVAGSVAGLYQYYRHTHAGAYPAAGLIKAILLNTADDLGVEGPDFRYGWGRANAGKAFQVLQSEQYIVGSVQHGQQLSFQLPIAAGTQRVKLMLAWTDPAGSVLSPKALVNDLDLKLELPNGQQRLPWIPSAAAHLDSLNREARPGLDRRNNAEQVVITNPAPGYYNIKVNGHLVPEGPQTFYIVYELEMMPMRLVSPQQGTSYVPGEQVLITWDAVANGQPFTLEYSTNNGQTWTTTATNISPKQLGHIWSVPNVATHQLKFRLTRPGQSVQSEGAASISTVPVFMANYESAQTARLSWEAVPGAVAYKVYQLGEKYMEAVGTTTNLNYGVSAQVGQKYWLSVAAVFPNGLEGRRAIAKEYEHFGCENNVRLSIQFDRFPAETAWFILSPDGSVRASGGPYTQMASFASHQEVVCLPTGCFTLVFTDAYNDGMCCANGNGGFVLTDIYGTTLAQGGSFGSISYHVFCVEENNAPPLTAEVVVNQQNRCHGNAEGIASVTASGGTGNYTYQWSNGASGSVIQQVVAGTYSVTVTDGEQTVTGIVQVTEPAPVQVVTAVQPSYCQDGQVALSITGGVPPYRIDWADGGTASQRVNLSAGSYFAVVQDTNDCLLTTAATVPEGAPMEVSLMGVSPSCNQTNGGMLTATATGGNGNYQYQWSNGAQGSPQLTGLNGGLYAITVTAGNCQQTASLMLENPMGITVEEDHSNITCFGGNDGSILLNVTAGTQPFTFEWADGNTAAERTGLLAGVYLVTITDGNGCHAVRGIPLSEPHEIQVAMSVLHNTGPGDGSIHLAISGGSPPYTVVWADGTTGTTRTQLSSGQYTAWVTDAKGCTKEAFVVINTVVPNDPELEYCPSRGVVTLYEWINAVTFDGHTYTSGNDGGYGDHTDISIPLMLGSTVPVVLQPGYAANLYNEYWKVWIDLNRDGDFADVGELVFSIGPRLGTATGSFTLPATATGTTTRMRIAMRYGSAPELCTNPAYGEVEDFSVTWTAGNSSLQGNSPALQYSQTVSAALPNRVALALAPNPISDYATVTSWHDTEEQLFVRIMDAQGRVVAQLDHQHTGGRLEIPLDMAHYHPGMYFVYVQGNGWASQVVAVRQ